MSTASQILINSNEPRNQYVAGAAQTVFAYTFPIFEESNLAVFRGSTLQVLDTDYTVTGEGTAIGGNVTFTDVLGLLAGEIVTIYGDVPLGRSSDYQNAPAIVTADLLNDDLDRFSMMEKQLNMRIRRAVRLNLLDQGDGLDLLLPTKAARLNKLLGFNVLTGAVEVVTKNADQISQQVATPNYPATTAENVAGVTPVVLSQLPGDVSRYNATVGSGGNDSAAFQAAVDVASADNGGTIVTWPGNKTFIFGTKVTVPAGVRFRGTGMPGVDPNVIPQTSIFKRTANVTMFEMVGTNRVTDRLGFNKFEAIKFVDDLTSAAVPLIVAKYADSVVWRDVMFTMGTENSGSGHIIDAEECWDWRFYNTVWKDGGVTATSKAHIRLFNGADDNCNGWHFHSCRFQEAQGPIILFDSGGAGSRNNRFWFVQCKFEFAGPSRAAAAFIQGEASHVYGMLCEFSNAGAGGFIDQPAAGTIWKFLGCSFEDTDDAYHIKFAGNRSAAIGCHFKDAGTALAFINDLGNGNTYADNSRGDTTPLLDGNAVATTHFSNNEGHGPVTSMVADDTTPDVRGTKTLITVANIGATAITALDNGLPGQTVTIQIGNATNPPTIADSGNFKLSGAWTPDLDDTLTVNTHNGTQWKQVGRSAN